MTRKCYESVGSNSIYFSLGINSGESLRGLIADAVHQQCELIGFIKGFSRDCFKFEIFFLALSLRSRCLFSKRVSAHDVSVMLYMQCLNSLFKICNFYCSVILLPERNNSREAEFCCVEHRVHFISRLIDLIAQMWCEAITVRPGGGVPTLYMEFTLQRAP